MASSPGGTFNVSCGGWVKNLNSSFITNKGRLNMQKPNLTKALLAGVVGTIAMTMLTYIAPIMGMPEMNIPQMLSGFMGVPIVAGWLAHFMVGTVFAIMYAYIFVLRFPGSPVVK